MNQKSFDKDLDDLLEIAMTTQKHYENRGPRGLAYQESIEELKSTEEAFKEKWSPKNV